jgi:predicted permease
MAWYHRLANLARARRLSRDLDREIAFHLAERVDELVAAGMSREEAERTARRRFGNPTALKERTRDVDVLGWLESILADLRYAVRALRRSPGFAAVAILSLGLGIGANTAIFSIVDAVMLRSLPVVRPQELLLVTMGGQRAHVTNPIWEQLRDRQEVFSGVFAIGDEDFDLAGGGEVRRVSGAWVSGAFFSTLGVPAAAGRLLAAADDVRGCPAIAVLGHDLWRNEYAGDPSVVGRPISLDGHPFTIVGVAAPGFFGVEVGRAVQVYAPLCAKTVLGGADVLEQRSYWYLRIVGRPKADVSVAALRGRLAALAPEVYAATVPPNWGVEGQRDYVKNTLDVVPASDLLSALRLRYRGALLALMGAVGLVLLIACANVANLLLARATVRQREIGVRLAIGAGRGRIVRQLLTESVLLAFLGAVVGLLFARWGIDALVGFFSGRTGPVSLDPAIDGRVLLFTTAVATATGILFGLAPAWRATRISPQAAMRANLGGLADGRTRLAIPKALVVAQVALSVVLVTAAGLLLGTLRTLATLDPGFTRDGVLLVAADLRKAQYPPERLAAVHRELLDRLRALPGVRSASAASLTPVSGSAWNNLIVVEGHEPANRDDALVYFNEVSEGYFATLRTPIVAGRDVGAVDRPGAPRVAVINREMARRFFGSASPLGRHFRERFGDEVGAPVEIVGVVENAKYESLRAEPEPIAYLALSQSEHPGANLNFAVRADAPLPTLLAGVTTTVAEVSPSISLEFRTLEEQVNGSLARERLLATLSGFFGALALLLATVGLYGTTSYSVARRHNEFGIRLALGAARSRVVRMVLGEVGRLVALGIVLGTLGALAASRVVASFLFGVSPTDPATFLLSAGLLVVVAIVAGLVPAWRVARLDPVAALRDE